MFPDNALNTTNEDLSTLTTLQDKAVDSIGKRGGALVMQALQLEADFARLNRIGEELDDPRWHKPLIAKADIEWLADVAVLGILPRD